MIRKQKSEKKNRMTRKVKAQSNITLEFLISLISRITFASFMCIFLPWEKQSFHIRKMSAITKCLK